jgi:hypothetical protein
MKKGVGGEMMQLNAVVKQQTAQKVMHGEGEPALKISGENAPPPILLYGNDLIRRKDESFFVQKQTLPLDLAMIRGIELGAPPENFLQASM